MRFKLVAEHPITGRPMEWVLGTRREALAIINLMREGTFRWLYPRIVGPL